MYILLIRSIYLFVFIPDIYNIIQVLIYSIEIEYVKPFIQYNTPKRETNQNKRKHTLKLRSYTFQIKFNKNSKTGVNFGTGFKSPFQISFSTLFSLKANKNNIFVQIERILQFQFAHNILARPPLYNNKII